MKSLKTANTDIVRCCQDQFGFKLLSELITRRAGKIHSEITGFRLCIKVLIFVEMRLN